MKKEVHQIFAETATSRFPRKSCSEKFQGF